MNCNDYQQWINRLIDHEVKATESAELFEHLGKCAECRGFYGTLMQLNAELDKMQTVNELEKDTTMQHRVSGDLGPIRGVMRPRSLRSRISTFALLIIVTLFIGFLLSVDIRMQRPTDAVPQNLIEPR